VKRYVLFCLLKVIGVPDMKIHSKDGRTFFDPPILTDAQGNSLVCGARLQFGRCDEPVLMSVDVHPPEVLALAGEVYLDLGAGARKIARIVFEDGGEFIPSQSS
jgi:hypothetical protein